MKNITKTTQVVPRNFLKQHDGLIRNLASQYYTIEYIRQQVQATTTHKITYQLVRSYMLRNGITNLKQEAERIPC